MFVLLGLLVTVNVFGVESAWDIVGGFAVVVLLFVVIAWFIAFKTGTPATVSLECSCCICPCGSSEPSSLRIEPSQPHGGAKVSAGDEGEEPPVWDTGGTRAIAGPQFSHEVPGLTAQPG